MTEGKHKSKADKADAAEDCGWRGDGPEPELDDLAHKEEPHRPRPPDEVCSWQGDPPEPELDDLAHSPQLSPRSQVNTRVEELLEDIDPMPLDAFPKPENHKKGSKAHFKDEQPGEQVQDATVETLQEKITHGVHHGVHHVLTIFHNIVNPSSSQAHEEALEDSAEPPDEVNDAPSRPSRIPPIFTTSEPQHPKGKTPREEKERAKREKAEARKAEKERRAREKEEKKRLKVERRRERREHRERRHKEKDRHHKEKEKSKNKGKETETETASLPDLPPGADGLAATESHHHPGCPICEHPEEQGTHDFMKGLLESWEGVLPSLNDLIEAALKLMGLKSTDDTPGAQHDCKNLSLNEQELIEHIAAHIDKHMHHYTDHHNPSGEGNSSAAVKSSSNQQQQASCEGGRPTSHGLDGNRDWPMTIMQGHVFRSIEPMSAPDVATAQSPSPPRDRSPFRTPTGRCVSPWCEKLGLKLDDPPLFQKPTVSWSRRGFNSSPSRMRTTTTSSCLNAPLCLHPVYHEHGLYACVPVSLVPALSLEPPCCGHSSCHYAPSVMTPMPVSHTPRPLFKFEPPFGTAETIPPSTPRRSLSASETQIVF
ncbi:hypothetical protein F5Y00DRAFT_258179 [Daldinia vernicosa]|uniref:uncharacterized protein n=1 Tax=Daldinia vernicosa TaxID=114800 RepID=UPI002007D7C2|nr:uncharacterized protein F5Y00DRAFT_258179 [Daldinia vernicosa]KAI0852923.1 hypothetical protein F5Y00DRAFT_258179 [Daldinia vernicosa]